MTHHHGDLGSRNMVPDSMLFPLCCLSVFTGDNLIVVKITLKKSHLKKFNKLDLIVSFSFFREIPSCSVDRSLLLSALHVEAGEMDVWGSPWSTYRLSILPPVFSLMPNFALS